MNCIGITGTIAAGKSTIRHMLKEKGYACFDSDAYAKRAYYRNSSVYPKVVKLFGKRVIDEKGKIQLNVIRDSIFVEDEKRKALNRMIFPFVEKGIDNFKKRYKKEGLIFCEVPLLYEANMEDLFDYILVVSCKKEIAIERMMENRGYTKEEARARYQSQSKQRKEMLKADFVLYNDTCISDLEKKLDAVMKELKKG